MCWVYRAPSATTTRSEANSRPAAWTIQVVDVAKIGREFEPGKGAIALHVEALEAARSELESRGVNFQGETMDSGVCYQAFFEDQDGNPLILHHATHRLGRSHDPRPSKAGTPFRLALLCGTD